MRNQKTRNDNREKMNSCMRRRDICDEGRKREMRERKLKTEMKNKEFETTMRCKPIYCEGKLKWEQINLKNEMRKTTTKWKTSVMHKTRNERKKTALDWEIKWGKLEKEISPPQKNIQWGEINMLCRKMKSENKLTNHTRKL